MCWVAAGVAVALGKMKNIRFLDVWVGYEAPKVGLNPVLRTARKITQLMLVPAQTQLYLAPSMHFSLRKVSSKVKR
jgi:hypothetical protein